MLLLDQHNAEDYLRRSGKLGAGERVTISALTGGVSNQVLYVARPDNPGEDFVLKQARPQLRTPDPWFASVERIWREVDVLRICQEVLQHESPLTSDEPRAVTPRIGFEDRPQYVFAMSAAPRDHRVWKQDLLAGHVDPAVARACGRLLGQLHAATWLDASVESRIGDRRLFDELRIDPYYRSLARAHPDSAGDLERLIEELWSHRRSLVHADFSPKNLLVFAGGLMMVDFETGHFGDPAFDLGFFLSHLVLKAFNAAPRHEPYLDLIAQFFVVYSARLQTRVAEDEYRRLIARTVKNFAGCAWARLDGTSKIDYLDDPRRRESVRSLSRDLLRTEAAGWDEAQERIRAACRSLES